MTFALGLLLAGACFAQTNATNSSASAGLLGQRYAEFGFALHDLNRPSDNTYSLGTTANFPMVPALLDVSASYAYDWHVGPSKIRRHTFLAAATAYASNNALRPFASYGIGWQTRHTGSEDQAIWRATAGFEIDAGNITLTPRVTYIDDFEAPRVSSQQLGWGLEGNTWVTSKTGLFASFSRTKALHTSVISSDYQIGVRVKF